MLFDRKQQHSGSTTRRPANAKAKGLLLVLGAAFSAGCASVPADAGLKDVRDSVARRGGYDLAWSDKGLEDRAIEEHVRTLLAEPLTADHAVDVALWNNRELHAALAGLSIARADLLEASLPRNPVMSFEIRSPSPIRPFEIAIMQTLLDLIQLPRRKRIAAAEFERVTLATGDRVVELAAQVRQAFYEAQAAEQKLALERKVAEAARAASDLAQRQLKAGNITSLMLENQQALYEQARLAVARAEADRSLSRERLNRTMGTWGADTAWTVAAALPAPPQEEVRPEGLESLAVEARLDLAAARAEVEAAARAVPGARLERIGEFGLGVHIEREDTGETTTGPSVEFALPLFNQGQAAAARARARLLQTERRFTATAVAVRNDVRAAWARLSAARTVVGYYAEVVLPRRQRLVELTQLEVTGMQMGVFQLLQARQNEIQAERESVEAQRDYWLARAELERAVGGPLLLQDPKALDQARGAPAAEPRTGGVR